MMLLLCVCVVVVVVVVVVKNIHMSSCTMFDYTRK